MVELHQVIDCPTQAALRKIRLYHWQEALKHRNVAKFYSERIDIGFGDSVTNATLVDESTAKANMHIKFVQELNEFFPIGDTAEGDLNDHLQTPK